MAKAKKEKAPSLPLVRMLCTLIDFNAKIWSFTSWGGSHHTSWNYRGKFPAAPDGREQKPDVTGTVVNKALKDGLVKREDNGGLSHKGLFYSITDAGREFAEKWRHLLEEVAQSTTFLIVKNGGRYSTLDKGMVGPLCKVVRETDKRIYVEVIRWGMAIKATATHFPWCSEIHGNAPNEYVDVADVFMRDVDPEKYEAIWRESVEYAEWQTSVSKAQAQEEEDLLAEMRKRFADRRLQRQAQFVDTLRDLSGQTIELKKSK